MSSWSVALFLTVCTSDVGKDNKPAQAQPRWALERNYVNLERTRDESARVALLKGYKQQLQILIEGHRKEPETVAQLRFALLDSCVRLGDTAVAAKVASELLADYKKSATPEQFRGWYNTISRVANSRDDAGLLMVLSKAALDLNLELPAHVQESTDGEDEDCDGAPLATDRCRGFDDRKDSDRDGVPDGCDLCWGFPDAEDSDEDGLSDHCDFCPGKPDRDNDYDDVVDGCDNCPKVANPMVPRPEGDKLHRPGCECHAPPFADCCWQPDWNKNGLGDACDKSTSSEHKTAAVRDREGKLLDSYEYDDAGQIKRSLKWDAEGSVSVEITYHYNEARELVSIVETPQDGTPPRITKVFHDENGRFIGQITDGQADDELFHYFDQKGDLIKITTAADPPEAAVVLERIERDHKGREIKREKRLEETGQLETVVTKQYTDDGDGTSVVETRERLDERSERLTFEGFDERGFRTWIEEYPDPISPRGARPKSQPLVTDHFYDTQRTEQAEILDEWKTTVEPSGRETVDGWRYEGEPDQPGSKRIFEEYMVEPGSSGAAERKVWRARIDSFFPGEGYMTTEERDSSGLVRTYERDKGDPVFVLTERTRYPTDEGEISSETHFTYDAAGRVIREIQEGGGQREVRTYEYDYRGCLVQDSVENRWGILQHHREYDAHDRSHHERTVVRTSAFSLVLPGWSVSIYEELGKPALLANWWSHEEARKEECSIAEVGLIIRTMPTKTPSGETTAVTTRAGQLVASPEAREALGASEPEKRQVRLCGREFELVRFHAQSKATASHTHVAEMVLPLSADSSLYVALAAELRHVHDIEQPCPAVAKIERYLFSLCLDSPGFNAEEAWRRITADN